MFKKVIICIAVALVLLTGAFLAGWFISAGTSTNRIANLEATNQRLVEINTELERANGDSLRTIDELTKSIGDAQATVDRYRKIIAEAESGIFDIDRTVQRLEKICEQIGN